VRALPWCPTMDTLGQGTVHGAAGAGAGGSVW
jgi:hypothetical protein